MVTNGGCLALVVNTGMNTEMGLIDSSVQAARGEEHKTPLTKKLDVFGNQLSIIVAVICAGVWLLSIPKFSNPIFSSPMKGAIFYAKIAVALVCDSLLCIYVYDMDRLVSVVYNVYVGSGCDPRGSAGSDHPLPLPGHTPHGAQERHRA